MRIYTSTIKTPDGVKIKAYTSSDCIVRPFPKSPLGYDGMEAHRVIAAEFAGCEPEDLTPVYGANESFIFVTE